MAIERICVFDQGLGCWTGHWVNFNDNIRMEVERRHLRHLAFGNKKIDPSILNSLPVEPLFSMLPWTDLSGNRETDYQQRSEIIYRDLAKALGRLNERDLVLFPTVTAQDIGGIARFVVEARERTGCVPVLLAQSAEGINVIGDPGANWATAFFRRAIADLSDPGKFEDVVLLASSSELSVHYSIVFGRPVEALCMPTTSIGDILGDVPAAPSDDGTLRVGYFGHSSFAKGGHLLNEIVQAIKSRYPNVEFILHVSKNPETQDILSVFDTDQPRVTCLRGHISREDYYRALDRCDIVLLPYDRVKYGATPSSVLSESLVAGKVVVGPENTWISREIWRTRAGATLFGDFSVTSIVEALSRAIEDHDRLKRDAQEARKDMRRRQNVQGFVDGLLDAAKQSASPSHRPFGWKAPVAAHWHLQ